MTETQAGAQPPASELRKGSNVPYIIAIVIMALLGLIGVLTIEFIREDEDNTQMIGSMLGFIGTMTVSLLGLMKSQETHLTVNSQLAIWKKEHAELASAQGEKKGMQEAEARMLAKQVADAAAEAIRQGLAEKALLLAKIPAPAPLAESADGPPLPVKIVAAVPVPVKETPEKKP